MTTFVRLNIPYIDIIPVWAAFFINFINISATFVWNYTDIFIMIISIGLSTHFQLINKELERANIEVGSKLMNFVELIFICHVFCSFQNLSHQFWINVRKRYTKSCNLVADVDKSIGHIILFSYLNNLFLICKQLFESLR